MEEGNRKDEGGGKGERALSMRESSWCVTLIVVMNLLRHIRYRDRVPPSRTVWRTSAPTRADDLARSHLIFGG